MKKIYTLLAAACVGVSAMAVNPAMVQLKKDVSISPEKIQALSARQIDATMLKDNGVDRVIKITDAEGNQWSELITLVGTLQDALGLNLTFEDFPFYTVLLSNQAMYQGANTQVSLYLNWPAKASMDRDLYKEREDGQGLIFDVEAAKAKYGETALDPMTFDEMKELMGETPFYAYPGLYYNPTIIGREAFGGSMGEQIYASNTVNGNAAYPVSATDNGESMDIVNATSWMWQSFDDATSDVETDLQYKYSSTNTGSMTGAIGVQLTGAAIVLGFSDIVWDNIGQVHIFNAGRQEYGDDWTWNLQESFDGALNMYYLAMCDNTMAYIATETATGKEVTSYTDTELPVYHGTRVITGGTDFVVEEDYHFNWVAGAIWAPENADKPYGTWTMAMPKDDGSNFVQTAAPYNLFYRDSSACGDQMGFYIMYEGYLFPATPEKTILGIGDKDYGLNFRFATATTFNHSFIGTYTDPIYYHAIPNEWTKYENLDVKVPGMTNNAIDADPSSVESVESDAPVVSATYYNFQGQRLSSEPESGMYIIRAVKADGTVKATKVAK